MSKLYVNVSVKFLGQRRHTFVDNATRYDVLEPRKVDVTVERQSVAGDQVAAVHAHGADLVVPDPDTRVWRSGKDKGGI